MQFAKSNSTLYRQQLAANCFHHYASSLLLLLLICSCNSSKLHKTTLTDKTTAPKIKGNSKRPDYDFDVWQTTRRYKQDMNKEQFPQFISYATGLEPDAHKFCNSNRSATFYYDYSKKLGLRSVLAKNRICVYFPPENYLIGGVFNRTTTVIKHPGFIMSSHEISCEDFSQFVNATNYITTAEKRGWSWVPK